MKEAKTDSQATEKQKALNNAFYATLAFVGINLLFLVLFSSIFQLSFLAIVEIAIFLLLGYLTKKSSKKAVIGLLVLFLFDRLLWVLSWLRATSPYTLIGTVIISFVLWTIFYKAYLHLK